MIEGRHPLAKLWCAVLLVLAASVLEEPRGLGLIAATVAAALVVLEQRSPLRLARRMAPFLFMAAAMSWVYLVADNPAHRAVAGAGAQTAILVATRIVTMGLVSLAFAETTRPDDLARALEQNAGLPRRYVQGVLAAIQFLPVLAHEYRLMRMLQQARVEGSGWGARFRRVAAALSPELLLILLAGALRRAGAAALSMQMRGLGPGSVSPVWRRRDMDWRDGVLVVAGAVLTAAAVLPA